MQFIKNLFKSNKKTPQAWLWAVLRIFMGWIFLWPFLDKTFGLGFATPNGKAWLDGVSPTFGFLQFGTQGPLTSFFQSLATSSVIEWLFMLGLLLIGLALILGVVMKIASYSGSLMLLLMWLALLPPQHNPFLDDHLIYIIVLITLVTFKAGQYLGLGNQWSQTKLVKKYPVFE